MHQTEIKCAFAHDMIKMLPFDRPLGLPVEGLPSRPAVNESFASCASTIEAETENNGNDASPKEAKVSAEYTSTKESSFVPVPVLAASTAHAEHNEAPQSEEAGEVLLEGTNEAVTSSRDSHSTNHHDLEPVQQPVSHHRPSVQHPSHMRTENPNRNLLFVLAADPMTDEVGWFLEGQSSRYQSSPCLESNVPFPIRPLGSGILAGIHNHWLGEFPEPPEEIKSGLSPTQGKLYKRFPTANGTFESQHVRSLWQELERRRILEMNDPHHIHRLRHEAMMMLRSEAMQRKGRNGPASKSRQDQSVEPTEEEIDIRSQLLWDQSKRSAVYAVGLLRQAEYCIAQGHLGFVPLQHPLQTISTTVVPKKSRKRSHNEGKQRGESTVPDAPSKRKGRNSEA